MLYKADRRILGISDQLHHIKANTNDENMWVQFFDDMLAKRDLLFEAITTFRDYATDLTTTAVEWVKPQRGFVSPDQEVEEQVIAA